MAGPAVEWNPRRCVLPGAALVAAAVMVCAPAGAVSAQETATEKAGAGAQDPEAAGDAASGSTSGETSGDPAVELARRIAKWEKVDWEELVQRDPVAFLQKLRQKCSETIVDFAGTFHKQERIRGKLRKEEAAEMKFRSKPFSVYMKFIAGDKGREALYVDGKYDNKIQVHPGGVLGALFQVKIAPDSKMALKDNLRPITMAGMTNMLHTVVPQFELAQANGDLKVEYLGVMDVGGRKVYAIKRILPEKDIYPCKELVLFVDCIAMVPTGADAYGWDGQIGSKYRYTNLRINVGLTDEDFDRKNKSYNF